MWNWNKAIAALVAGLILPGLSGPEPWIVELWELRPEVIGALVAFLAWLVPAGRPIWQVWKKSVM